MSVRETSERTHHPPSEWTRNPEGPPARRVGSGRNGPVSPATAPNPDFPPATYLHFATYQAQEIAKQAVRELDELALLGYPILDPATRAVYEVTVRLVAERVLDRG